MVKFGAQQTHSGHISPIRHPCLDCQKSPVSLHLRVSSAHAAGQSCSPGTRRRQFSSEKGGENDRSEWSKVSGLNKIEIWIWSICLKFPPYKIESNNKRIFRDMFSTLLDWYTHRFKASDWHDSFLSLEAVQPIFEFHPKGMVLISEGFLQHRRAPAYPKCAICFWTTNWRRCK